MLSWSLIAYVLIAAVRDRLMIVSLTIILVGAALSTFLGSSMITEAERFSLVFTGAGLRFAGMAALVLFIVFYIRRAFETREVEFLLSRPISRGTFICSHATGVSLLAVLIGAFVVLTVYITGPHYGAMSHQAMMGVMLWGASLIAEFVIMANAALFFSMVLSSPTGSAMACFGLYILGRLMGEILGIVQKSNYIHDFHLLGAIMKTISLAVPRLDLMAQSSWLIYGVDEHAISYGFIFAQGFIYSSLLILAALVDLARRQF